MSCGRRNARFAEPDAVVFGAWWSITGFCIFAAVIMAGVAMCRGARRAKAKARERALSELLALMSEADRVAQTEAEDSSRVVGTSWVSETRGRGEHGERFFFIQTIMPNGTACAAMMCPAREQTLKPDGEAPKPSCLAESDTEKNAIATTSAPRFHLPSFEIDHTYLSSEVGLGLVHENQALRQLRGRPRDRRMLENALLNLSRRDPDAMSLDEIKMASLALRRAREQRELVSRLRIIGAGGAGPGNGSTRGVESGSIELV